MSETVMKCSGAEMECNGMEALAEWNEVQRMNCKYLSCGNRNFNNQKNSIATFIFVL